MNLNRYGEICGDNPSLTPDERRKYVGAGFSRIFISRKSTRATRRQHLGGLFGLQKRVQDAPSPIRVYTEACLTELIPQYCPESAVIIDVGCGPGEHYEWFKRAKRTGRYIGIDVKPNAKWKDLEGASPLSKELEITRCEELSLPGISSDFSLSSSALEHIEDDAAALRRLAAHASPNSYGLHIVPSSAAFLLYGYHGWRYYSPSSLSEIFTQSGYRVVETIKLGGFPSFMLHLLWIGVLETAMVWTLFVDTLPDSRMTRLSRKHIRRFRYRGARTNRTMKCIYGNLLRFCLWADRFVPAPAHGYAVVVQRI